MPNAKYDGKSFYNLDTTQRVKKTFGELLKWHFTSKKSTWPQYIPNQHIPQLPSTIAANEVFLTLINHVTFLIQLRGLTILTDPVFSERVSPFSFIGPKRHAPLGLNFKDLPKIDVVIITHNHYDHMDVKALTVLHKMFDPLFIVPLKNSQYLAAKGITKIIELDWWESHAINDRQRICLVPAQHWSARSWWDANQALWGSYIVQSDDLTVYFAGDTGYNSHFKLINSHFNNIDVSLIPIGSYEPRWFMKEQHVNPEEAVKAHMDLQSKLSIGMHFGTFQLTDEAHDEPPRALKVALNKYGINENDFIAPGNGQTIYFKK